MARKYSTDKERRIHQEAVKLRKMTDKQLVDYTNELYMSGFNTGLDHIKEGIKVNLSKIKGIGKVTQSKIIEMMEDI